jgi:hypothetical protein
MRTLAYGEMTTAILTDNMSDCIVHNLEEKRKPKELKTGSLPSTKNTVSN